MIPIARALKIVDRETSRLAAPRIERVELAAAVGRVLAEDVVADSDLPPFDRSQMDGFAVVAADTKSVPLQLKIVGESAAGRGWHKTMKPGEAVRIMTGAPVPAGADAVQKVENTRETGDVVEILETVKKGTAIVRTGAEIKAGTTIFRTGERITEAMIATLASFGYARVKVGRVPRVAILGTGSEIVPINKRPGRDQIRNSNSMMLDVMSRRFGAVTTVLPIIADDVAALTAAIKAAAKSADILVMTGGVSVGKYDHTKAALAALGTETFFEKIQLKPGKPTVFARSGKCLIFGLPGNPVSAAVTFHLFVRRAMLLMQGTKNSALQLETAILASAVKAPVERDSYIAASLSTDKAGHLVATSLRSQGSSDFVGFARAEALIVVGKGTRIEAGDTANILLL